MPHIHSVAAKSILSTAKVWATDLAYLNDSTEWVHGHELFAAEVESRAGRDADLDRALGILRKSILDRIKRKFLVLVASLSEDPDDLALGRPYADDGAGCSIGIDLALVPDAHEPGGAAMGRVIYEEPEKRECVARIVTEHFRLMDQLTESNHWRMVFEHMAWSLQIQASLYATTFKHHSFRSEREWRLVQFVIEGGHPTQPILYRVTRAGVLAPYVEVDVSSAIVDLVIGPKSPPVVGVDAWTSWLRQIGKESVQVRRSEAPYRPM